MARSGSTAQLRIPAAAAVLLACLSCSTAAGTGADVADTPDAVADAPVCLPLLCPDSLDPCAKPVCVAGGGCGFVPRGEGSPCEDGKTCTVGDTCVSGACVPSASFCTCKQDADCLDDADLCNGKPRCAAEQCVADPATVVVCPADGDTACLESACQPATGQCALQPVAGPWSPCDDGEACTTGDYCLGGVCQPGFQSCMCQTDADCAEYEDGDVCNGTLVCDTSGPAPKCVVDAKTIVICGPDQDTECTKNTCEQKTGACQQQPVPFGTPCDDGDPFACTYGMCSAGQCVLDFDVCSCTQDTDCATSDDGDKCNGTLVCDTSGPAPKCVVDPKTVVTCAPGKDTACSKNLCAPKTGQCQVVPVNDGEPCDDGDSCSVADACAKGQCQPGVDVCQCQTDADCADFEDGDKCNGTLVCDKSEPWHKCVLDPKTVVTCAPDNDTACSKNLCAPKTGQCQVVPVNDGKPCDDGDSCSVADACAKGQCQSDVDVCQCQTDADCADFEDGNACNGTLVCDKSGWPKCAVDPKTVVSCPAGQTCQPASGTCAPK